MKKKIRSIWKQGETASINTAAITTSLKRSNFMGTTDLKKKISHLKRSLEIAQSGPPTTNISLQKSLCHELHDMQETEEIMWNVTRAIGTIYVECGTRYVII